MLQCFPESAHCFLGKGDAGALKISVLPTNYNPSAGVAVFDPRGYAVICSSCVDLNYCAQTCSNKGAALQTLFALSLQHSVT